MVARSLSKLAFLLAFLAAPPAFAAYTIEWEEVSARGTYRLTGDDESCVAIRVSTANEADDSMFLFVGGASITIQSDGDAAGAGASEAYLYSCSSPDGDRDGTLDTLACAPLPLVPGGTNRLDGSTVRGTLTPLRVAGWIYLDPDPATISGAEVFEATVCRGL